MTEKDPTTQPPADPGGADMKSVKPKVKERAWEAMLWRLLGSGGVVAIATGSLWLAFYLGGIKREQEVEQSLRLARDSLQALDAELSAHEGRGLVDMLEAIKREATGFRHAVASCDASAGAKLEPVAMEWAEVRCRPAPCSGVLPERVSKLFPIQEAHARNASPTITRKPDYYEITLERGTGPGSFSGACWEFGQHVDLSHASDFEVMMSASVAGTYDFKFERENAAVANAYSNVEVDVPAAREISAVRVSLGKVPQQILPDVARFCLATASATPGSPTKAVLHVSGAGCR